MPGWRAAAASDHARAVVLLESGGESDGLESVLLIGRGIMPESDAFLHLAGLAEQGVSHCKVYDYKGFDVEFRRFKSVEVERRDC
jgi:hypothetical protein